jgi:hypothetical protein
LLLFVLVAGLTAALQLLFTGIGVSADDTGWQNPGSDNATGAGTGHDGFEINPQDAYLDDNVSAENQGGLGDSHLFYNFGLGVPLDATVKGIQVRLDWSLDSDIGTSWMDVELSWNGGSNWTSPISDEIKTTVEHTAYLGDSANDWGHSWTPNEFSNDNLRVRITCNSDTTGRVFYLEYLSVIVYYAPVHHLEVIGDATISAGGSNVLTVRARDTFGDIAANYNGPKSLTFSGPSQAPGGQTPTVGGSDIGVPISVTFTDGVSDNATATTLLAYRSEVTTVHVTDGTSDSFTTGNSGLSLTVNPDTADHIIISPDANTITAGDTQTYTAQSFDQFDNPIADVTTSTAFSIDAGAGGSWATNVYTSEKAETWTITGTYATLSDTASLAVNAGPLNHYEVTSVSYSQTTGTPFTVTVTAHDQFHNLVNDSTTSVTMTSGSATMLFDANGNGTFGEPGDSVKVLTAGTLTINARDTAAATGVTITATGGGASGTSLGYTISAGPLNHYEVTSASYSQATGIPFSVTVTAHDQFHNLVNDSTTSVTMTSSSATMLFDANGNGTFGEPGDSVKVLTAGTLTINARDTAAATNVTITATGGGASGISLGYAISALTLDHFEVTSTSYTQTAGAPFTVTVTAHDQFHNLVNDSTTSVTMTSSSPTMLFDANVNGIFGEPSDNVRVLTAGTFNITARDTTAATGVTITATGGGVSGTSLSYTISAGPLNHYEVTSTSYSQIAGIPFTVTVVAHDQFHNLVNDSTTSVTMTSSSATMLFDANGNGTFGEPGDNVKVLTSGTFTINARDTAAATGVTITATGGAAGTSPSYTITTGGIDHYEVTSVSYSQTTGTPFSVTVTAHDQFHNLVNDSTTSVTMTSSSATMLFDANGNGTFGEPGDNVKVLTSGAFNITARDTTAATGVTITATGGGASSTSIGYTISAGPLNHYEVTSASYSQTAGIPFTVIVTAHDQFHNLVNDSTTSVTMTSSSLTMAFDANGDGTYGDNSKTLTNGAFNITARDTTAATGITVTATGGAAGTSLLYTITAGGINHYEVTSASYSQTAGIPFTVTVTAHDQFHNLINDSTTSVTMTSSSPTMFFDANGNGIFGEPGDNLKVLTAGTFNITTWDTVAATGVTITATGGGAAGTSPTYTISAGSLNHYEVTSTSYSQAATVPFTVTVTAHDQFHNLVNDSTTSVTMSSSSVTMAFDANGDSTYGDNSKTLTNGTFNITAMDTTAATGVTITATGVAAGTSLPYTITPGGIHHYEVTSVPFSQTAGIPFTVTVTAHDQFHNLVNDSTTSVTMTSSSPTMLFDANNNGIFGEPGDNLKVLTSGTFNITARDTRAATGVTITATGGGVSGTSLSYTISAGPLNHYEVTSTSYSQIAGIPFTVTVVAHDQFHNLVNDSTTSVTMTSSSATMLFDANGNGTFGEPGDNVKVLTSGTFTINARDTAAATGVTITATGGAAGTSPSYTITTGGIDHYEVTSVSYSQTTGTPFSVTVTAHDQFHNLVNDSTTSVTMTSSSATMLFDANGNGTFGEPGDNVRVLTAGTLTINARDTAAATGVTITATGGGVPSTSLSYTISAGPLNHYEVTSTSYSQTAGVPFTVTIVAHDQFHNLVNDSTTSVTMTSSSPTMLFDANDNGIFGEAGDNVKVLTSGALNMPARDSTAAAGISITATGGGASGTSLGYTISAGPLNHYEVTSASYSQTAGIPFTVIVTAHDQFHNLVNDSTTSVTMTSSSPTMLFDANGNGIFGEAGDNVKVLTSGAFNITARDTAAATNVTITATGGGASGTSLSYTVDNAGIDHYEVTSASYSQTAGILFTVTVTANDQFHNVVNDSTTSVIMTSNSPTMLFDANGNGIFGEPGDNVKVLTAGTFNITARDTIAATGVNITATDGAAAGTSPDYSIGAGPLNHYEVASASYSQSAGTPFAVTVTAHDQFHNLVNDNTTSVTVTSGSPTMLFDANGNSTFGEPGDNLKVLTSGTFNITARDTRAATGVTITATGGGVSGTSLSYTISAGALNHYTVSSDDYTQQVTVSFTVTVTAYDAFENLVTADNVTVTMSSSPSLLIFDGNDSGIYGEAGDDTGLLTGGILDIQAKASSATDSLIITATDINARTGISEPYLVEDFRCFIASAAYGTPMIDQIQVLRDFRDGYLMTNPAGRWFVSTYYRYSPPLARFIARHDSLRASVRAGLTPVIWLTTLVMKTTLLQKMAMLVSMIAAISAAVLCLRRRRQSPTP